MRGPGPSRAAPGRGSGSGPRGPSRVVDDDDEWETDEEEEEDEEEDDDDDEEGEEEEAERGGRRAGKEFDFGYLTSGVPAGQRSNHSGPGSGRSSSGTGNAKKDAELRALQAEMEMYKQMAASGGLPGMPAGEDFIEMMMAMSGEKEKDASDSDDEDEEGAYGDDPMFQPQNYAFLKKDPRIAAGQQAKQQQQQQQQQKAQASSSSGGGGGKEIRVGDTIKLAGGDKATVHYVGPVHYANGEFVGVVMKNPSKGKNDGSVKGKRYFSCAPGAGLMVKLRDVERA